jgi:MATE family multidrug resistance protein
MQNAIIPLIITLVVNVINIVLSFYFVRVMNMGAEGVAFGTVIAQYSGFVLGLLFLIKYKGYLKNFRLSALAEMDQLLDFLRINVDIFIRTLSLTSVFAFFYSMSAAQGKLILAVNTILMQFLNWMSYGIDGFAFAAESLVGKYKGAADERKLMKSIKLSFLWAFILALITALLYGFKGEFLLRLFTNDPVVIALAKSFLFWMALFPLIGFASYIWDGIYIGLTASKAMRNSMLVSMVLFFICYYALRVIWPIHSMWIALITFLFVRAVIQHILFSRKGLELR